MSTGRSNQLIKQVGEYLVACELARRGLLVATFSGNVPDFDLIVTDGRGSSCPIQVKTIKGASWQFTIDKYAEISFEGNKQRIGARKPLSIPDLVCVFVAASEKYGGDQFYVLTWSQVQDIIIANYTHWLDTHGGVRPRRFDSKHCAVTKSELRPYINNWSIISDRF